MPKNTDWIVMRLVSPPAWLCQRCKAEEPQELPAPVRTLAAKARAFLRTHSRCNPDGTKTSPAKPGQQAQMILSALPQPTEEGVTVAYLATTLGLTDRAVRTRLTEMRAENLATSTKDKPGDLTTWNRASPSGASTAKRRQPPGASSATSTWPTPAPPRPATERG